MSLIKITVYELYSWIWQKAFDTVNHNILLFKLEQYGIRGIANNLIRSYLTNRWQFVSGGGFSSSQLIIDISVPQGSVLGPILFLIYINDLSSCSNFETTLHADDSVLTLSHKDVRPTILQTNLDCDLPKIEFWLHCHQLSLNTSKCSYLFFTKNKKKINLTMNNYQKINQSNCVKYLGVYLDDRLSWCRHIDYIVTKMSSATGVLYKLRRYIPQSYEAPCVKLRNIKFCIIFLVKLRAISYIVAIYLYCCNMC